MQAAPAVHKDSLVLALDFGGSKLAAALVEPRRGKIIFKTSQERLPTANAQWSLEQMIALGRSVLQEKQVSGNALLRLGVSFGGPLSRDRRCVLRSMHVPDWEIFPLVERLEAAFGCPAFMDNDANAAALGEWRFGAGRGLDSLLYVQISTGVGAGIIASRQLLRGAGLAGEFGHMTIAPDGPECVCGKRGCVESFAAGWALARDGRAALADAPQDSPLRKLSAGDPQRLDARQVCEAVRQGDPNAAAILDRAARALGMAIANAVVLLDPQAVLIGGGVSRSQDVLTAPLTAALTAHLPLMFQGRCPLKFSQLGGDETLLGAALLNR